MAAGDNECRMRLHEYRDLGGGILGELPGHIKAAEPQILELHIIATPANAPGFLEIDPPTSVFAETTAVAIETYSSSGDDGNEDDDHLQGISTIGINGNDKMITVQNLATTAAWTTYQLEEELWKNIFHCFGSKWGTGDKDPAGAVDVRTVLDAVIVELVAGDNEGNGAAFVVPDGHCAMLYGGKLRRLAPNAGVFTTDEGIRIRIVYIDAVDALIDAADRSQNWLEFELVGAYESELEIPKGHIFEEGTQIIHQDSSKVEVGEQYDLYLQYLIWKK